MKSSCLRILKLLIRFCDSGVMMIGVEVCGELRVNVLVLPLCKLDIISRVHPTRENYLSATTCVVQQN